MAEQRPDPFCEHSVQQGVEGLIAFYEGLSPASLELVGEVYAPDARFKDPFNDVTGHVAIRQVFAHMFESVEEPRFRVVNRVCQGDQAVLEWVFSLRLRGSPIDVCGASMLRFGADGRVRLHRDYWDPLEELLAKLPLVGVAARYVRRRMASGAA